MKRARARAAACGLLIGLSLGCRSERRADSELCASACAALSLECSVAGSPSATQRRAACNRACEAAAERAHAAGCAETHRAYLSCLRGIEPTCAPPHVSTESLLEGATALSACAREHAEYFRCTAVCRDAGSVWTRSGRVSHAGKERRVHAELVLAGCSKDAPPSPPRQSGAGAVCTHHSVCTPTLCSCEGSHARYFARACVDEACANGPLACALVPHAVGHDPCPRP